MLTLGRGSGIFIPGASSLQGFWGTLQMQQQALELLHLSEAQASVVASAAHKEASSVLSYVESNTILKNVRVKVTECNVFDRVGIERWAAPCGST